MLATGFGAYIGKSQKGDPSTRSCAGSTEYAQRSHSEPSNSLDRLQAGYGAQKRSENPQGRRFQHDAGKKAHQRDLDSSKPCLRCGKAETSTQPRMLSATAAKEKDISVHSAEPNQFLVFQKTQLF